MYNILPLDFRKNINYEKTYELFKRNEYPQASNMGNKKYSLFPPVGFEKYLKVSALELVL